ncbi:MAG TPA: tyrosine-type recombinase/integrase [Bryobacteraceae bacterium]
MKRSKVLGFVFEMTKGEAREAVGKIVAAERAKNSPAAFGQFVEQVYFRFKSRRWKESTRQENVQRVNHHLVSKFGERELASFQRDELQDFLDSKGPGLSFSVVDHLRWDIRAIFEMAVAEGLIARNPALMLFTPKEAKKPVRRAMTIDEVQKCFRVLGERERLIAKLAVLTGMRPGEIFGLKWEQLGATYADIRQRVYRGLVDTPKTEQSFRKAALSEGLIADVQSWRLKSLTAESGSWVFPSERLTPMSKDNCWRRNIQPRLAEAGLGWVNFQVMRRTHATLMKALGADGKLVADQLGHSLDVNQNVYTQSTVESRLGIVNCSSHYLI